MKKILILSCSTGEGHNSAARAVQSVLEAEGNSCVMADPVAFQSQKMERLVAALYNNTSRKRPQVFGAVYRLGDLYASSKLPSPVYWANAHYSRALKNYIEEEKFDAVISSHLYGMEALTALKKRDNFKIPCYGIITDYTCIPFLKETVMDGFFSPTEGVKQELISSENPAENIYVSGIPVDVSFAHHCTKEEARKTLEISTDGKVFLVMTGGVGCENMEGLCDLLLEQLPSNGLIMVLTGNNQNLKKRLEEKYGDTGLLKTVSFTRQVPLYMAASDVVLSKPGGLSSTEAAVANIPLVHIHAIPGCETCNARYFSQTGMSLWAKDNVEAVADAIHLVSSREASEMMCRKQREEMHPDAARYIAQKVVGAE